MELEKRTRLYIEILLIVSTISLFVNVLLVSTYLFKNIEQENNSFIYRYDVVSLNDHNYAIIDNINETIIIKGIDSNSYNNEEVKIR
jgi:hypothetical protein